MGVTPFKRKTYGNNPGPCEHCFLSWETCRKMVQERKLCCRKCKGIRSHPDEQDD